MRDQYKEDTKEKEVLHTMPTVEDVYFEMTDYLAKVKKYVSDYTKLPEEEAKKKAHENLMQAGIIDAQGNLTGFYKK